MNDPVLEDVPLGFPWPTVDPFLFCVHHLDRYPKGNAALGPDASLAGRDIGQDFAGRDGWRMYHGDTIPGFPQHPHRGFETVTIVRSGFVDHSDSLGATARFGAGDVQWLTAGAGIVHAEMFPLLLTDEDNPVELFQIWLNLPAKNKFAPPYFTMLWREQIPTARFTDASGHEVEITVIAGQAFDRRPPSPPPHSWASEPDSGVAIWTLKFSGDATWSLPRVDPSVARTLYFFRGGKLHVGTRAFDAGRALVVHHEEVILRAEGGAELLLLQGRPLGERVVQHGPFVMNTEAEIAQAFADYRRTQFGGWPWTKDDPAHARGEGRFARRPEGGVERPG